MAPKWLSLGDWGYKLKTPVTTIVGIPLVTGQYLAQDTTERSNRDEDHDRAVMIDRGCCGAADPPSLDSPRLCGVMVPPMPFIGPDGPTLRHSRVIGKARGRRMEARASP